MSGGKRSRPETEGWCGRTKGAAGGATVPRFAPEGLGLDGDGAASPHFKRKNVSRRLAASCARGRYRMAETRRGSGSDGSRRE